MTAAEIEALAKIGYSAFVDSLGPRLPQLPWEQLPSSYQEAWRACARAVHRALGPADQRPTRP